MNNILVSNRKEILAHTKYIGSGVNGKCYLTKNNEVIKIFKDNYRTEDLFRHKDDIKEHIEKLSSLSNESYLAPTTQILESDKLIGYITPYGTKRTLAHVNKRLLMSELLEYYKKLVESTYDVSEKGFWNHDLHDKNILVGDKLYVIDLDHGEFYDYMNSNDLFRKNIKEVNYIIMSSLLGVHNTLYKKIKFSYLELEEAFNKFVYNEISFDEYLEYLYNFLKLNNPTVGELSKEAKKMLKYQSTDEYYRHY